MTFCGKVIGKIHHREIKISIISADSIILRAVRGNVKGLVACDGKGFNPF